MKNSPLILRIVVSLALISAVLAFFVLDWGGGKNGFGNRKVFINSSDDLIHDPLSETDAEEVHRQYIEAFEEVITLMDEGRGDTAEASAKFAQYERLKKQYEKLAGE